MWGHLTHAPVYRKVIPRQVAMLLKSIIKTQSNIVISTKEHVPATLYLLWGLDVTTLKVFDLTELQEHNTQQHIHWNMPESSIRNTSVNEPNQRCKI